MQSPMADSFGRQINYMRLSVTDRCNFRCVYCMAEDMTFLPKQKLLTYEEIVQVAEVFISLGIQKIRLTGGEPLIRQDIVELTKRLNQISGLNELAITTNGARLVKHAEALYASGVKSLNVSLDTLETKAFQAVTRIGKLNDVLRGIQKAKQVGFERIKLNAVIMRGENEDQISPLIEYALSNEIDISFIEEMPLGQISSHDRGKTHFSSNDVREVIEKKYQLVPTTINTGGPSKYFSIPNYASKIGFISPLTNNFCASCNRIRMTAEGKLLLCLGNENSLDIRGIIRRYPNQPEVLKEAILNAIKLKPKAHDFSTNGDVQILRFMNMTGG